MTKLNNNISRTRSATSWYALIMRTVCTMLIMRNSHTKFLKRVVLRSPEYLHGGRWRR